MGPSPYIRILLVYSLTRQMNLNLKELPSSFSPGIKQNRRGIDYPQISPTIQNVPISTSLYFPLSSLLFLWHILATLTKDHLTAVFISVRAYTLGLAFPAVLCLPRSHHTGLFSPGASIASTMTFLVLQANVSAQHLTGSLESK